MLYEVDVCEDLDDGDIDYSISCNALDNECTIHECAYVHS